MPRRQVQTRRPTKTQALLEAATEIGQVAGFIKQKHDDRRQQLQHRNAEWQACRQEDESFAKKIQIEEETRKAAVDAACKHNVAARQEAREEKIKKRHELHK